MEALSSPDTSHFYRSHRKCVWFLLYGFPVGVFSESYQQTLKRVTEVEKRVRGLCFTWKQGAALSFPKNKTHDTLFKITLLRTK